MKKNDAEKLATYLRYLLRGFPLRIFLRKSTLGSGKDVCLTPHAKKSAFLRLDLFSKEDLQTIPDTRGFIDSTTMLKVSNAPLEGSLILNHKTFREEPRSNSRYFYKSAKDLDQLNHILGYTEDHARVSRDLMSLDSFLTYYTELGFYRDFGEPLEPAHLPWWDVLLMVAQSNQGYSLELDATAGGSFRVRRGPMSYITDSEVRVRWQRESPTTEAYVAFDVLPRDESHTKISALVGETNGRVVEWSDPEFLPKVRDMFRQVCRSYLED
jgi:hypothetical protein